MTDAIHAFLRAHDWHGAERDALAGDAGGRRYERLRRGSDTAILLDGAADVPIEPYLAIGGWLRSIGVRSPAVFAADPVRRLILLEDLGDDVVANRPWSETDEIAIYRTAAEVIARTQSAPAPAFLPRMDDARLIELVSLFLEQKAPLASQDRRWACAAIWRDLLPHAHLAEPAFLHRDYHSPNLIWCPEALGLQKLGVLDFQDAFIGPVAYDLVSLIDDPRRDVAPAAAMAAIERYLELRPELDRAALDIALAILGAQRALRILAVFHRLATAGGKPAYRHLEPRVEGYLHQRLTHPVMAPLRHWYEGLRRPGATGPWIRVV